MHSQPLPEDGVDMEPQRGTIHVYWNQLWERKYQSNYEKNCNDFLLSLHHLLTGRQSYCILGNARQSLLKIGDWFVNEKFTYIRIYGATKALHLLPKIVTDHMVLMEISYQSYCYGIGVVLNRKKE